MLARNCIRALARAVGGARILRIAQAPGDLSVALRDLASEGGCSLDALGIACGQALKDVERLAVPCLGLSPGGQTLGARSRLASSECRVGIPEGGLRAAFGETKFRADHWLAGSGGHFLQGGVQQRYGALG